MTDILFLGVGNVANAVNHSVDAYEKRFGTTRSVGKLDTLRSSGIEPVLIEPESALLAYRYFTDSGSSDSLTGNSESSIKHDTIRKLSFDANVLVSFPPDGWSDEWLSLQIIDARKIIYISSTSVYGGTSGVITEGSPVEASDPIIAKRLEAEQIWLSRGAIILRAPSLYGPDYGLHVSLSTGRYKLPGDGCRYSSRIHLEDLSMIIESAFAVAKPGSLYLVGDKNPATHIEVVEWLCKQLRIPMPESSPVEEVHYTLRANRQINSEKLLSELGIKLRFPTYKDGFLQCIRASRCCESK